MDPASHQRSRPNAIGDLIGCGKTRSFEGAREKPLCGRGFLVQQFESRCKRLTSKMPDADSRFERQAHQQSLAPCRAEAGRHRYSPAEPPTRPAAPPPGQAAPASCPRQPQTARRDAAPSTTATRLPADFRPQQSEPNSCIRPHEYTARPLIRLPVEEAAQSPCSLLFRPEPGCRRRGNGKSSIGQRAGRGKYKKEHALLAKIHTRQVSAPRP